MIRSTLRYIRQKPKAVRNQYALALASGFTAVVAVVWFMAQVPAPGIEVNDEAVVETGESSRPFANLFKQAREQWAAVRGSVGTSTAPEVAKPEGPGTMTLTPETLADAVEVEGDWTASATVTASATPPYREIQIMTAPRATATATSTTP